MTVLTNPSPFRAADFVQGNSVAPAAGWTGVTDSGFSAVPSDPARTTAKPILRLLTPPRQAFTDALLVGVTAWANDNGSLLNTCGLSKVTIHYEGTALDIPRPTFQTIPDANGVERIYFGWWAWLRHDGRNGLANVYFEATARDATMQKRVIGPYRFLPSASIYSHEVEIAATPAEIAGQRYKTFTAAADYFKSVSAPRPRITVTEAGTYVLAAPTSGGYQGTMLDGRVTVRATAAITLVNQTGTTQSAVTELWRPFINPYRFIGANITFDFAKTVHMYSEVGDTVDPWFDGVTMIESSAKPSLWRGRDKSSIQSALHRAPTWFTEVTFTDLYQLATQARLVRGCTLSGGYEDLFDDAECVIGTTVHDWDSRSWITGYAAMTVSYVGAAATATIEGSGYRTFTLKANGATVSTFTVVDSYAAWNAGTNKVQAVVDWINGVGAGWSATLIDNRFEADTLGPAGTKGFAFGPTSAKGAPLELWWMRDVHADYYQKKDGYATENVAVVDNHSYRIQTQNIFVGGTGGTRDIVFANNTFANFDDTPDANDLSSQVARPHSHVVIAHNSLSTQNFFTREDVAYDADAYCLFANNVFRHIVRIGTPDLDLAITNNHFIETLINPAGATGSTFGGTKVTLFVDQANGDLTPAGLLLTNLKAPLVKYDRDRVKRGATAPVGALA